MTQVKPRSPAITQRLLEHDLTRLNGLTIKSYLLESLYEALTELCLYMRCPGITKSLAISPHRETSLMNGPLLTRPKCHQGQCENLSRLSARSSGNTFAPLGTSCHRRSWSIRFASPSSVVAKLCRPNQSDEQCEEPQPTKTSGDLKT